MGQGVGLVNGQRGSTGHLATIVDNWENSGFVGLGVACEWSGGPTGHLTI